MNTWFEYILFRAVRAIARKLPFQVASRVGSSLGMAVFRWTSVRRKVTRENLLHAFPGLSEQEHETIAAGAYRNYGRAILEFLWCGGASEVELRSIMRLANGEVAREALARGKGLILLSGHYGSWELILPCMRLLLGWPLLVIVQRQRNEKIDALIDAQRRRFDTQSVPMGQSVREVLKVLHDKKVLILLGDQSGSKESVYVPFFGRPAATHRGTAAFALKSGAPLVMFFLVRQTDGTYLVNFEEVESSDLHGSGSDKVDELTRRHVAVLERHIRLHPDHWLWMHKRWKHTSQREAPADAMPGATQDTLA